MTLLKKFFSLFLPLLALVILYVALVTPNRLASISPQSFMVVPVELLIIGFLLFVPTRIGLVLRWVVSCLLAAGTIFKVADMATYNVFARPFNPVFDAYLLANGVDLLNGALGEAMALIVVLLLIAVVIAIALLAFTLLGYLRRILLRSPTVSLALLAMMTLIWGGLWHANSSRASTQFVDHLAMHIRATQHSLRDMKDFERLLMTRRENIPRSTLFKQLAGKDVLIVFVESYGRTLLDNPEFSQHLKPLLEQQTEKLSRAGIGARSAWLTSPTVGGLSWLAHGTAMSGLWIDSQVRYDTLVMSKHPSLNQLFRQSGWRTVGVMPAITMAWPEGDYYGYDHIYHAHNSGYAGLPFNWVTMPDQFTLAAFQRNELERKNRAPVMAEIALISSHAPWTPVPELIDWNSVGDGVIFNSQATRGDSPEAVWKDPARIRLQYRLSIEYAITTLVDYLLHYGNENLVVMVFGDHQPAPLVTGDSDNRDVPVHLFARDPAVLQTISPWQWSVGLIPADTAPVWRMDEVRGRLIDTFSAPE